MSFDICSIPVEEVFEPRCGCPICHMRDMLEERAVTYITGAAMMEPEVRKVTNQKGFCNHHFKMMLERHARLPVALMLESHLAEVDKKVLSGGILSSASSKAARSERLSESCFICDEVDRGMSALINNTVEHYAESFDFRKLFSDQPELCLPHYALLVAAADRSCPKRIRSEFKKTAAGITEKSLAALRADIKHFCEMFDYRNQTEEADWGNSKDAIERTVAYLTSREV